MQSFAAALAAGPVPHREHIAETAGTPRMLVTPLHPRIGYDKTVKIGKTVPVQDPTPNDAAAMRGRLPTADVARRRMPVIPAPGATPSGGDG